MNLEVGCGSKAWKDVIGMWDQEMSRVCVGVSCLQVWGVWCLAETPGNLAWMTA